MKDHGFQLDDEADIASDDQGDLDVRDSHIVYKFYLAGQMPSEEELRKTSSSPAGRSSSW